jgi:TonB family protein
MYKLLLSILLMILIGGSLCVTSQASQPDQEWERFRSVKEGFSVLFPERPAVINRGQYRKAPVRGARNYAAYRDGVVYFLLVFDNPDHEKPLEYFLESQLPVTELRDTEVSAGKEISNGSFKGQQYSLKKYDYRKSFSYPGVLQLFETKNRVLALVAVGKDETDSSVGRFLQSLEISEKPNGKDIGAGATYAESASAADTPVMPSEVSRKVLILIKPPPQYPEEARHRKLSGGVVVKGVLSSSGKVTSLKVVSGLPEFAQSALDAAHKIYFIPAVKEGRFVSTFVHLEYNFDIY